MTTRIIQEIEMERYMRDTFSSGPFLVGAESLDRTINDSFVLN